MLVGRTPVEVAAEAADHGPWSLAAASASIGVVLSREQHDRFTRYRRLLLAWNDRFNLTAVTDPIEVERRLFLDALRMVPALDDAIRRWGSGADSIALADVGSGAGFPGLALKIVRPALQVTLIEATGKKVAFLQSAIEDLRLDEAVAVHGRAEDIGRDPAYRARFEMVTARAVAALPALLELCVPLLRVGGRALLPKGTDLDDELRAGHRAAPVLGARIDGAVALPGSGTRLVTVTKTGDTPALYPRRPGIPAKEPLGGTPVGPGGRR